jgi:hypothetical protein
VVWALRKVRADVELWRCRAQARRFCSDKAGVHPPPLQRRTGSVCGVVETSRGTYYRFHNQVEALKEVADRFGLSAEEDFGQDNTLARALQSPGQIGRMPLSKGKPER